MNQHQVDFKAHGFVSLDNVALCVQVEKDKTLIWYGIDPNCCLFFFFSFGGPSCFYTA